MFRLTTIIAALCCTLLAYAQPPQGFGGPRVEPQYKNVNYAGDELEAHQMDIYLPQTNQQRYKVVVAIYESAWFSNNMKGMTYMSIGKPLTDAGFAVVCINHRSSGDAKFPAQIHDVKAAIRYLRANADKYKLDTSFIGITGFSSGGHLSALAGVTNGMKSRTVGATTVDLEGSVGGNLDESSRVDAVVDWFGPVDMARMENCETVKDGNSPEAALMGGAPADMPEMVSLISPITYVTKDSPRFLVFHGDADNVVPHCQSVYFSEELEKAGCLEEFITVPGGQHGPVTFNEGTFKQMVDFFLKESAVKAQSPDKELTLKQADGKYVVEYQGKTVLRIEADGYGLGNPLPQRQELTFVRHLREDYTMLSGKRLHCTNEANEYAVAVDDRTRLVWRLYNDGVAFRYELTGMNGETLPEERTAYLIPEGTNRWVQRWTEPYEAFFPHATTGESRDHRWGYPALIEAQEGVFALLSEADINRRQSASCLRNDGDVERYRVCPDKNDLKMTDNWHSPWRMAIVGTLADVVESTLVTDLSEPCRLTDTSWIEPGVVSWIYWAHNHGSNDYNIICQYVDMAVEMKLPYVLIDAEWDGMKDGKTIEDAISYAKSRGVKPMIWYNSSVGWINGAPGPKFRLNKPEDREREFAWCERLGVAGVKIDFFSGDNQMNMDYYIDLMESTARHHLLVNFHGATIPRGWQRTYPHMLTMEAVYGAEWYNNVPTFTDRAASHNATLPFTRNVIGPMDYTPCAFSDSQHPHITTHAHELALTVLFESGLQHLADRPESFLAQPQEVKDFLGQLPAVWDETRYVSGYPGRLAVIARRSGNTWYVAGINGTDEEQVLDADLRAIIPTFSTALLFQDGKKWEIRTATKLPTTVKCRPRGGFVYVVNL